ncbi:hypothetical protein HPT25_22695 [Bacillus sp. BRMEA1]|uniref:hypothetical protein n=1 Tax=Neobacillus endophyticus TaxID=2738405 RepID=UPI001563F9A1|nr:hypothetical protein [Neobacillus endophyticus]NRD80149.1 hypothetical protein [Neobacillus endophyticus]
MAKVKDSISVEFEDSSLHLIWDCDDEVGYCVEYLSEEEGIAGWAFGDNSVESYLLSEGWYEFTSGILTSTNNLPDHIIDEFVIWIEEGTPTEEDEENVLKMIELLTDFLGYHPLEEKRVNKALHSFGCEMEEGLWSKYIQRAK